MRGMDGKLYRLSSGSRATWGTADSDGVHQGSAPANLTEVTNVRDLDFNAEQGEADSSSRANDGWETAEPTLKNGTVEFDMVKDTADAGFNAFRRSWLLNEVIACAVLDGSKDVAGTEGLWADFKVMNFSESQPLREVITVSVTLRPARTTVPPEMVRVTS